MSTKLVGGDLIRSAKKVTSQILLLLLIPTPSPWSTKTCSNRIAKRIQKVMSFVWMIMQTVPNVLLHNNLERSIKERKVQPKILRKRRMGTVRGWGWIKFRNIVNERLG